MMSSTLCETESSQALIERAIARFRNGDAAVEFDLIRSDGHADRVTLKGLYESDALDALEEVALTLCFGRVLEIGAGLGRHTRRLVNQGTSVTPLDISAESVRVLRESGFPNAIHADLADEVGTYDTILMLHNGIGALGSIEKLDGFLASLSDRLEEGGALVCDSTDMCVCAYPPLMEVRAANSAAGRHAGVIDFKVRFEDEIGSSFSWLFLTEGELRAAAAKHNLTVEVVYRAGTGRYLAVVSPAGGNTRVSQWISSRAKTVTIGSCVPTMETPALGTQEQQMGTYAVVKGALGRDVTSLIHRYALLHLEVGSYFTIDGQVGSPSRYADACGEALLDLLKPRIETVCGEELLPTYSYMRVYTPGAKLAIHSDRPACEVSATITIGYSSEKIWPLFLQDNDEVVRVELDVGDLLIYKGILLPHWRDEFEGHYWIQLFLHYVKANGANASQLFDGRAGIGPRPR